MEAEAVVAEQPAFASATLDGVTVESNTGTSAELQAQMGESTKLAEKPATPAADETSERNTDGTFKKIAKPRNDAQARIDQVVREREEARRELAALKAERAQPRQEPAKADEPAKATPEAEWKRYKAMADAPKLDSYETIEEYNFAVAMFVADKRADERDAQRAEAQTKQQGEREARTVHETWLTRLSDARSKDPDFESKVNPDTPMSAPMQHIVKESPVGIELLQWLSAHQDDAQRLSTLHPAQVFREMGKLEARLEAASAPAPAPKAKPQSQATPPIQPVKGSSHVADGEPSDDDDDDTWYRAERARAKRR